MHKKKTLNIRASSYVKSQELQAKACSRELTRQVKDLGKSRHIGQFSTRTGI